MEGEKGMWWRKRRGIGGKKQRKGERDVKERRKDFADILNVLFAYRGGQIMTSSAKPH